MSTMPHCWCCKEAVMGVLDWFLLGLIGLWLVAAVRKGKPAGCCGDCAHCSQSCRNGENPRR